MKITRAFIPFIVLLATSLVIVPTYARIAPYGFWAHNGMCWVRLNTGSSISGPAAFEIDLNGEYFIWYMDENVGYGRIEAGNYILQKRILIFTSTFESIVIAEPLHEVSLQIQAGTLFETVLGRPIQVIVQINVDADEESIEGYIRARGNRFVFRGSITESYFMPDDP
jgi:hypothetical protein